MGGVMGEEVVKWRGMVEQGGHVATEFCKCHNIGAKGKGQEKHDDRFLLTISAAPPKVWTHCQKDIKYSLKCANATYRKMIPYASSLILIMFLQTRNLLQLTLSSRDQPGPPIHFLNGIADHLIDNRFSALPLINHCCGFTHQERPRVVHGLIIDVITQCLEVVLNRYSSLRCEFLDLLRAIRLPVLDVGIGADTEGPSLLIH